MIRVERYRTDWVTFYDMIAAAAIRFTTTITMQFSPLLKKKEEEEMKKSKRQKNDGLV